MTILKETNTPVFDAEGIPEIDQVSYSVEFSGGGLDAQIVTLDEIKKLPKVTIDMRMTSVSGFSVRADWQGVLWKDLMAHLGNPSEYQFVVFESIGGYTTNVYVEDLLPDRWLFCYSVGNELLEIEYGGPLRIVIPNLWGYKSCKWLSKVRFLKENEPGYWETRGYTDRGLIEAGETLDVNSDCRRPISGGEVTEF